MSKCNRGRLSAGQWVRKGLTIPMYSSRALAMNTGIEFQVRSLLGSEKVTKVMAVLVAPAAVTKMPPANRLATMICCLRGSSRRRTYGIGASMMRKSVTVLMHPAASKCCTSLIQAWGVAESVQYASGGLHPSSVECRVHGADPVMSTILTHLH